MGRQSLSVQDARDMLLHVSRHVVDSKDLLTQADKAIGDGDHGVGMARGFAAVRERLEGASFDTLDQLWQAVGITLLTSVGGAAGAIFGTLFRGGSLYVSDHEELDAAALAALLHGGLEAVQARGQARPGDKTMVDALQPAVEQAAALKEAGIEESLAAVSQAARQGMERTRDMVARVGKAKTLGERTLGHADPGAISVTLILEGMYDYVKGEAKYESG